jgi:hypothetical protein
VDSLLKKYVCVILNLVLNLFQYSFRIHTLAIPGMRIKYYKKGKLKKNMGRVPLLFPFQGMKVIIQMK